MYGKAPVVNSNCGVIGYRDDVLIFSLFAPTEAAANQAQTNENTAQFTERQSAQREDRFTRNEFVEYLLKCLNTDISSANEEAIRNCDAALSYSGSTEAERGRILRHRQNLQAALVRPAQQPSNQQCGPPCSYCDRNTGVCLVMPLTGSGDSRMSITPVNWRHPLLLGIGGICIFLAVRALMLWRLKPAQAMAVKATREVDFPGGVPIWFTLGVLAWVGVAVGGAVVRLERQDIIMTQKRLGEEVKEEELRKEQRRRDGAREQQENQNRRVEEQRREQEKIEEKRRAELESQRLAYERRVAQIAEGIRIGRCVGNPRGAYSCCDPGMWARPGGGCSRSPAR
jgi:hypothetical protein